MQRQWWSLWFIKNFRWETSCFHCFKKTWHWYTGHLFQKIWSTRASQIIPCTRQLIKVSSEGAFVPGPEVHKTTRGGNTPCFTAFFPEQIFWRQFLETNLEWFPQLVSISYWYSYSRGTNPAFASHLCQRVSVLPVYSLYTIMAAVPLG